MGEPFQLHVTAIVAGYTYYVHLSGVFVTVRRHKDFERETAYATGIWQPIGGYVRWSGEHDATSSVCWHVADAIDRSLRSDSGWKTFSGKVECAREMLHTLAQARGRNNVFFERLSRG